MNAADHDYIMFKGRLVRSLALHPETEGDLYQVLHKASSQVRGYVGATMFEAALVLIERQREEIKRLEGGS